MKVSVLALLLLFLAMAMVASVQVETDQGAHRQLRRKKKKDKKKSKNDKKKKKKDKKSVKLEGYYCGKWNTIIAARHEVVESEGCFIFAGTGDPHLYSYKQCWNRVADPHETFLEKAGVVVYEKSDDEIFFAAAEVSDVGANPDQVVAGTEQGFKSKDSFYLYGAQAGLGLAYKINLEKVHPGSLDHNACLKK